MDSADLSKFSLPHSGSRLLSEPSLQISSSNSSRTGPGGDNLSLSELSLSQRPQQHGVTRRRPFSLLAQPSPSDESIADEDDDPDEDGLERTMTQEDVEKADKLATKTREEKLQHDLFILKKLNTAFEVYKDALRETKSSTQRVAAQLEHTNALLDKYMNILAKSEKVTKLILDERWEGADVDEDTVEREYQEALEKVRREEEERQLAAQRERERAEREGREREERRERERIERERAEASKTAGRGSGGFLAPLLPPPPEQPVELEPPPAVGALLRDAPYRRPLLLGSGVVSLGGVKRQSASIPTSSATLGIDGGGRQIWNSAFARLPN
ncbi:DASH complex subunit duo1 [Grifola frondosa]|uniref:DASH complex subunit DUO1 n=1 Tax=Grifola frondosa TaxID=5627 RepID=A0A1C7LWK9_GRIFR|nr:DASH complex subunit duo1 [Grifola frondosa]